MLFFKCGRKSSPAARAAAKNAHTLNNFFLRYPPRKKRGGYRVVTGVFRAVRRKKTGTRDEASRGRGGKGRGTGCKKRGGYRVVKGVFRDLRRGKAGKRGRKRQEGGAGKDRKTGRRKRGKRGAKRGQGGAHRFCKRVQLFCTGEAVFLCLAAQEANRRDFFEKSVDGGAGICYTNIRRRGNRHGRYHGKTHHRL